MEKHSTAVESSMMIEQDDRRHRKVEEEPEPKTDPREEKDGRATKKGSRKERGTDK